MTDTFHPSHFSATSQSDGARDYLAGAASSRGFQQIRAIGLNEWPIAGALRLLDAGCGNGEVAAELATRLPAADVVAIDHSPDAIAEAMRRHAGSRADYQVASVYDLPFADGAFDRVRSERVLQHLADPDRAVAELTRVLCPGGRMLLIDTDWQSLVIDGSPAGLDQQSIERLLEIVASGLGGPGHRTAGRSLRRRMAQAGLHDVRTEAITLSYTDMAEAVQVLPIHRDGPIAALRTGRVGRLLRPLVRRGGRSRRRRYVPGGCHRLGRDRHPLTVTRPRAGWRRFLSHGIHPPRS